MSIRQFKLSTINQKLNKSGNFLGLNPARVPNMLAVLGQNTGVTRFTGSSFVTQSNNIYVCGVSNVPSGNNTDNAQIFIYDNKGTLLSQIRMASTSDGTMFFSISVDSEGNLYALGRWYNGGGVYIIKFNSSGAILWQRRLTVNQSVNFSPNSLALDSNNDIYVTGSWGGQTSGIYLIKYNTSGTYQWSRFLGGSGSNNMNSPNVHIDSSNNIYITSWAEYLFSGEFWRTSSIVAKYNTAGTLQWKRNFGAENGGQTNGVYSTATDSSGNLLVGSNSIVGKMSSSSSLIWARSLSMGQINKTIVDSFNNVYFFSSSGYISKFDSNGNIIWKNRVICTTTNFTISFRDALIDSSNFYLFGQVNQPSSVNRGIIIKLPIDGSGLGSYSVDTINYNYVENTATVSTPSITIGTATQYGESAGTVATQTNPTLSTSGTSLSNIVALY
jgi:hypothetical protein